MSSVCSLLSEEQFQCSVCLEVFTDPVSIPCGHNFCKSCISRHWDVSVSCQCPLCKKLFNSRPEVHVNTFISEMVAQFRQSALMKASSSSRIQRGPSSGEVLCDVCSETRLKALKSCLVCLASYCQTHLDLHEKMTGLKKHQLMDPVENLEDRVCRNHDRPLEMFCRSDQTCVCQFCVESKHSTHVLVPLRDEYGVKKGDLEKVDAEILQQIQERRLKIEKIQQAVKLSRVDADWETAASVEVFRSLSRSVESSLAQLLDLIEEKHKDTERRAEGFIRELEEEISELMKRGAEVEQLLSTEDHLHFLQNLPSLNPAPPTKDWTEVKVHSSYEGTVRTAVSQLEETLSEEVKKMCADVALKKVQQYAVDVTLDPDSASPFLVLSPDGKQVQSVETQMKVLDNPQRFSVCNAVLGKRSFSSGRIYFAVQVGEKTDWDLGVASESVVRKGKIRLSPKNGFWTVWLRNGREYKALAGPGVLLTLKSRLRTVGVFVDYEEGLVSFYDADTAAHIYSFSGCYFTHRLHPYFSPCGVGGGVNAAPLVIGPLSV
ncbi:zinc-binding protein A33-like [Xyrichtys novacula]|uniref:Zinc-binding protein A33-like n=1 Tax=Xyrichtys novacula TaxID=13765 RepID=A0AAV1F389_XYRNO|nr:zinc-binding protein A33-like [Xyrichtys novacula]